MRITELHVRNIASIVSADIDFTRDLCDRITGEPAPVFLISGDTGSGKSVILDSIAMALYKKTPRLEGVANKKQNSFRSEDGEEVGINSIEQYTRAGIGPKEECYSEVAFEGNDGREYRARLSLGMYMTNRTAANGRHPEHRKPVWEVKTGSAGWVKENSGETILAAVGMGFEQFCRMAMLAQGKFESFLTGDKAQREAVLEQLTDTERFSRYGAAISQIYKEAETAKNIRKGLVDNDASKPLPAERVAELRTAKSESGKRKAETDLLYDKALAREAAVRSLLENEKTVSDFSARQAAIEEKFRGEAYAHARYIVTEWDRTENERHALTDLDAARLKLEDCGRRDAALASRFMVLSRDIGFRIRELADLEKAKDDAVGESERLRELVGRKRTEIESLTERRDALDPAAVNAALDELKEKKLALAKLLQAAEALAEDMKQAGIQAESIAAEKAGTAPLKKAEEDAEAAYRLAGIRFEEAGSRYGTMSAGMDEAMVSLRRRLSVGDTCPLCGQHIDMILVEDGFRKVLSPLEMERDSARKAMETAEKARNEAATSLASHLSRIKEKEDARAALLGRIQARDSAVRDIAATLGLAPCEDLKLRIDSSLRDIAGKEAALKVRQTQAEELQKSIRTAMGQKDSLERALSDAGRNAERLGKSFDELSGIIRDIVSTRDELAAAHAWVADDGKCVSFPSADIRKEWRDFSAAVLQNDYARSVQEKRIEECGRILDSYRAENGKGERELRELVADAENVKSYRDGIRTIEEKYNECRTVIARANDKIREIYASSGFACREEVPSLESIEGELRELRILRDTLTGEIASYDAQLAADEEKSREYAGLKESYEEAVRVCDKWSLLNRYFGGTRFRTLVQSHILRPLLNNANVYLEKITDRYELTCSEENEQLSILVRDNYMKQLRSSTVLSGGEKFMISLALSLALSSLNRPDMNVNILFIDEGFGTLDKDSLESVMATLETLGEIAGQSKRRVGIISHREELEERIPVRIHVSRKGQGRSAVDILRK